VTVDEYEYIPQFYVTTMYKEEIDIIIGLPWFKNLGTFILNMENKCSVGCGFFLTQIQLFPL
jgi:hypothetical protein